MKSACLLVAMLSLAMSYHTKHRHHKKSHLTPKGAELADHYGANTFSNIYGPRPHLVNQEAYVKNNDGSVSRKRIRIILGTDGNSVGGQCDITQKDNYYVCLNLNNCDLCAAADVCGWCEVTQQCLPSTLKESACPGTCLNGWHFDKNSCDGIVRSGRLGNFDP